MKKHPLLLLTFFLLCSLAQAQRAGKDYAVFFYVTDFQPGWARLPETAVEATALRTELSGNYNFICEPVPNPTKQAIRNKIREYNQRLTPNDQVFFFFSMHGYYNAASDRGYLVASDGSAQDRYGDTYLSYDDLRTDLAECKAKHILLALDACHSGSFGSRSKGGPDAPIYEKSDDCATRINNTMQYPGRQYCTSGNKNAKTPAKSVFAARLLEALRKGGEGGIVQFDDLEYWVGKIGNPQPESGSFSGHEPSGDFVFVRKYACGNVPPPDPGNTDLAKDLAAWRLAKDENSADGYRRYLQTFPNGEFHQLAREGMDKKNREAAQNRDDLAWQVAIEYNSIAAYQRYQREFSQGLHYNEASAKILHLQSKIPDDGLVLIKGGTFTMGCTSKQQDCYGDDDPAHQVTLNDFYIGAKEVTQKEWQDVMGSNPSSFKNCDECPVENVAWGDIQDFIITLNTKTGRQYRLPTEAEWEYAAREGGKTVLFGNGKNIADPAEINFKEANANYSRKYFSVKGKGTYFGKTTPVGSFSPNSLGLYDMSGNVWEFCNDWYDSSYYSNSPSTNPTGPSTGSGKVIRGGSWGNDAYFLRVMFRASNGAMFVNDDYIGFRLARTP